MGTRTASNIRILRHVAATAAAPVSNVSMVLPQLGYVPEEWENKASHKLLLTKAISPADILLVEQKTRALKTEKLLNWKSMKKELKKPFDIGEGISIPLTKLTSSADFLAAAIGNFIAARATGLNEKTVFSRINYVTTGQDFTGNQFMVLGLSDASPNASSRAVSRLNVRFEIQNDHSVNMDIWRDNGNNTVRTLEFLPLDYSHLEKAIGGVGNTKLEFVDAFLRTLLWTNGNLKLKFPEQSAFRGQKSQLRNCC